MKVLINHDFSYDVEHLVKIFYKHELVEFIEASVDEMYIKNSIEISENAAEVKAEMINSPAEQNSFVESFNLSTDVHDRKRQIKRANSRVIYDLLSNFTKTENDWGTLVGIRPVKIVHKLFDEGKSEEEIESLLYENHRISTKKRKLLLDIAKRERQYIFEKDDRNRLSLYICIPFCPTRCLYCSFPSNDLRKKGKLVDIYFECLLKELDAAIVNIKNNSRIVDCIYIGGGTPSILTAQQFEMLLNKISVSFNLENLEEFTVEAGRPDTITSEKLEVLKKYNVDRICINPQSMNQNTLELIGRSHFVNDIIETYNMAKTFNFKSINMDLILGLPDETIEDVRNTLDIITSLEPENITIHTLAVKTSSRLKENLDRYNMTQEDLVRKMLDLSEEYMIKNDYYPYYMYRQKNMVGNFENVGYAKEGLESLYNMRIIEEKHDILAIGAGAVSKRCFIEEDRFERIANVKGIEDYIDRIDDVIEKGKKFFSL